jgi:hypothetical protein
MGWACNSMDDITSAFRIVIRTLKGKRLLDRTRCRWEDNITMNLSEIECVDWVELVQYSVQWWIFVNSVMILRGSALRNACRAS